MDAMSMKQIRMDKHLFSFLLVIIKLKWSKNLLLEEQMHIILINYVDKLLYSMQQEMDIMKLLTYSFMQDVKLIISIQ